MIKPIFIIGCPRSGTTLILNIMACHEEFAWVSNYLDRLPFHLRTSKLNKLYDLPYIGKYLYLFRTGKESSELPSCSIRRYLPAPLEPWSFWNAYLSNFQWKQGGETPPKRRTSEDISSEEIRDIRNAIHSICRYQGKKFFLSKYTDFPRIQYLLQAFPDACFVHITRDGRAVAASYLEKIEKGPFQTWSEREWWIQGWPKPWRDEWIQKFNTPLSFVAFQWKFFVNEIWKDAKTITKETYMEVKYEDIIKYPVSTILDILEFCGLNTSRKVPWYLERIAFHDMNQKWKEKFSDKEKEILEEIIHEPEFRTLLDHER